VGVCVGDVLGLSCGVTGPRVACWCENGMPELQGRRRSFMEGQSPCGAQNFLLLCDAENVRVN
jgi:hypothetical protein